MAPRVVVLMVGQLADLHAWGRDARRRWWALVSWSVYGNTVQGNGYRYVSAWVPASALKRSADPSQGVLYRSVERLDLNADPATWPTPAGSNGRSWTHYGAITAPPRPLEGIATIPNAVLPGPATPLRAAPEADTAAAPAAPAAPGGDLGRPEGQLPV